MNQEIHVRICESRVGEIAPGYSTERSGRKPPSSI